MNEQIKQYLDSLSNSELLGNFFMAKTDLEKITKEQSNTEWHEACFAATILYLQEANKRGLKVAK